MVSVVTVVTAVTAVTVVTVVTVVTAVTAVTVVETGNVVRNFVHCMWETFRRSSPPKRGKGKNPLPGTIFPCQEL
jgi:hypothetical protein